MTIDKSTSLEYNTERNHLIIPEYGRNIQKMVEYCKSVADREERNKVAKAIIDVMGQLNPHLRDIEDYKHKLWAHLFIIADFDLDVDSPYEIPTKETFAEKPDQMIYPKNKIRYGHYGANIQRLIDAAIEFDDSPEKDELILDIANLMKRSYLTWNRDTVEDEVIAAHLKELSGQKLELKNPDQLANTSALVQPNNKSNNYKKRPSNKKGRSRNKKRY